MMLFGRLYKFIRLISYFTFQFIKFNIFVFRLPKMFKSSSKHLKQIFNYQMLWLFIRHIWIFFIDIKK